MRCHVFFRAPHSVTPLTASVLAARVRRIVCLPSLSCRHFKRLLMLTLEAAVLHVREGKAR